MSQQLVRTVTLEIRRKRATTLLESVPKGALYTNLPFETWAFGVVFVRAGTSTIHWHWMVDVEGVPESRSTTVAL